MATTAAICRPPWRQKSTATPASPISAICLPAMRRRAIRPRAPGMRQRRRTMRLQVNRDQSQPRTSRKASTHCCTSSRRGWAERLPMARLVHRCWCRCPGLRHCHPNVNRRAVVKSTCSTRLPTSHCRCWTFRAAPVTSAPRCRNRWYRLYAGRKPSSSAFSKPLHSQCSPISQPQSRTPVLYYG